MDKAYDRTQTARSRELRNNPTDAEQSLWYHLRSRQLAGARFNRQVPIGPFIGDFVSRSAKLVVELDGGQHSLAADYDAKRTTFLEQRGYRVIRFWNADVLEDVEGVLRVIEEALKDRPSPNPSREREGSR